jgi:hypothetical protein
VDANKFILEQTLKFFVNFVTYKIDKNGVETNNNIKITKSKFLSVIETEKIRVKLVDNYPEIIDAGIMYVKRNGRTVWYKEDNRKISGD